MSPGSVFASTICGAIIITAPTNVMNTKHNAGTDTHPGDFTLAMIAGSCSQNLNKSFQNAADSTLPLSDETEGTNRGPLAKPS